MFGLGMGEVIVILLVALVFVGPEKLPDTARKLSKGIRSLRQQTTQITSAIEEDSQIGGAIRDLRSALTGDTSPQRVFERELETALGDDKELYRLEATDAIAQEAAKHSEENTDTDTLAAPSPPEGALLRSSLAQANSSLASSPDGDVPRQTETETETDTDADSDTVTEKLV